jgi:heme/copper-type cytochrome/quinol oxidase subunit 4
MVIVGECLQQPLHFFVSLNSTTMIQVRPDYCNVMVVVIVLVVVVVVIVGIRWPLLRLDVQDNGRPFG